jgi:hypothetical protein
MKPGLIAFLFAALVQAAAADTVALYTFGDETNGATLDPESTLAGVTVSTISISPSLIDGTSFTEAQPTNGNPDGRLTIRDAGLENMQAAIDGDEYVEFTIDSAGTEMTLDGLSFDASGGGSTGTRILGVFVSTDGFASDPVPADAIITTSDLGTSYQPFSGDPGISGTTSVVTVRIYAHTGSNSRDMRIDNLAVSGFLGAAPTELPDLRVTLLSATDEVEIRWVDTPNVELQSGIALDDFSTHATAATDDPPDKVVTESLTGFTKRFFRLIETPD